MESKDKIFRDPIYGYITIPEGYTKDFIDTDIFQRLRRIEQTSMRVLYPSAHHDRFAHSIGVYHLGQIAFSNLRKNSESFFGEITPRMWENYKCTFEIACLMHDCGHSPFSHTFEHYYLYQKEELIKVKLAEFFKGDPNFIEDYISASPAEHEKISALILLEKFNPQLKKNNATPELAARMIMGCRFENESNLLKKFENKLISLLNGTGIDVDTLDYIQRDSWASGVSSVDIDYNRLLSSLMIKPDNDGIPQIVFKKNVLSVLDNIGIGRNFLFKWIYSHHKVNYEQNLLKEIVETINSKSKGEFCNKVFSIESFSQVQTFNNTTYLLPTDDDIMHTIKQFRSSDSRIEELLSRRYKLKALWKTYFEFNNAHFENVNGRNRMTIVTKIKKDALAKKYGKDEMLCLNAAPKLKSINQNDFFIDIEGKFIDASKATGVSSENLNYFILYVSEELISKKQEIIKDLLKLQS